MQHLNHNINVKGVKVQHREYSSVTSLYVDIITTSWGECLIM